MEFTLGALANDVFWGSKVSLGITQDTSNFFSQLIVLEKTSRGFPRATQHSVLRGGGVRPFAAWIAVVGRPVVVLVVIRAIAVTVVIRIALVAVRTARAVVSVPLGKIKITFQSEGTPRRERNGGREEREK